MRRLGMRTLLALILALVAISAHAQGWNSARPAVGTQTGARTTVFTPGPQVTELLGGSYRPKSPASLLDDLLRGRQYIPGPAGSGNGTFIDGLRAPGPGPAGAFDAQVKRSILWPATAKAASRALPLIGTALIVKDLYDEIRCREAFGGGSECDPGASPGLQNQVCVTVTVLNFPGQTQPLNNERVCASAPSGLAAAVTARLTAAGVQNRNCTLAGGNGVNCEVYAGFWTGLIAQPTTGQVVQTCPPVAATTPSVSRDGKCATGVFVPVDYPDVEGKIRDHADKNRAPGLWRPLSEAGIPFDHETPEIAGPGAIQGGRETLTRPDGTTRTRDTDHPLTYSPGEARWEDRITEREWPAGTAPEAPGTPPGAGTPPGTTTTGAPAPAPIEVITCGLPGKPPCKIDESGTPSESLPDPAAAVAGATAGILACIGSPTSCFPAMPTLSWDFALPTACGLIPLPAFAPYLESIDICEYQPLFHQLMGVVWQLGGLFGAISIFWRKVFSGGP